MARIAERHGLSERQARATWKAHREAHPGLLDTDPVEIIRDAILRYDAMLDQLAEIVETAKQDSVKLGAINAQVRALGARLELMQAVGMLPRDLGLLRIEFDLDHFATTVVEVFEKHGVSREAQEALMDAIRSGRTWRGQRADLN